MPNGASGFVLARKRIANPTGATDPLSILISDITSPKGRPWLKRDGALIVPYATDFLGGRYGTKGRSRSSLKAELIHSF
jgi:hypothetical protein